jgi:hypothetical protein
VFILLSIGVGAWVIQEAKGSMTKLASIILRTNADLDFYVGECPMFEKYWWWANQMAPSKKKRRKKNIITPHPLRPHTFFKAQKTKRNL